MLEAAARKNPGARWWLKGDGCDLVEGLKESMRLQWSGDVDLNTGDLQKEYESYKKSLDFAKNLSLSTPDLEKCSQLLIDDKKFVINGELI